MTFGPRSDTAVLIPRARKMRERGVSYCQIARELGTWPVTVKRWLDPVYATHRRRQINRARHIRKSNGSAE